MNPLRDCHLRTHQILRGHTRIFARAYFLRPNNVSHVAAGRTMCHAGTKSARPSIAPLPEPSGDWQSRFVPTISAREEAGAMEAVNSIDLSHSSRKAWRIFNKLTGRSGYSFTSAPSRQTPSSRNLWRTGHTRPWIANPPGWSARNCPTYGKSQHLRVTVSLNPLRRRTLLLPSDAWSQESLRDRTPSSRSSYSTAGRLSNLGFATSSVPACANSKVQKSGEEH